MTMTEYYFWRACALLVVALVLIAAPVWVPLAVWRNRKKRATLPKTGADHDAGTRSQGRHPSPNPDGR
jgi:hypothetical protein